MNQLLLSWTMQVITCKPYGLPPKSSTKVKMAEWLDEQGIVHGNIKSTLKAELMRLAKSHFTADRYACNELPDAANHIVLRLPPHHCHFNPITRTWAVWKAKMRRQTTTFKTDECVTLAYECAKQISSDVWNAV